MISSTPTVRVPWSSAPVTESAPAPAAMPVIANGFTTETVPASINARTRVPSAPRSARPSLAPPPNARVISAFRAAQTIVVPGVCLASRASSISVPFAESPEPTTIVFLPRVPRAVGAVDIRHPVEDAAARITLADGRNAAGTRPTRRRPGPGGVDHRAGEQAALTGVRPGVADIERRGVPCLRSSAYRTRRGRSPSPGHSASGGRRSPAIRPAAADTCRPDRFPVGKASSSGACHPNGASRAAAALSRLYRQGENMRTCPQARANVPTPGPASRRTGSSPLASRCAAAARPTGPAPMTATGSFPLRLVAAGVQQVGAQQELMKVSYVLRSMHQWSMYDDK